MKINLEKRIAKDSEKVYETRNIKKGKMVNSVVHANEIHSKPVLLQSFNTLTSIVRDERSKSQENPDYKVPASSLENAKMMYDKMGCNQPTHKERIVFDKCLTAKLYMRSISEEKV